MTDFLDTLFGVVLGAVLMWFVNRRQTRHSDLRSRVSMIETQMRSLEAKATEYWLVAHGDEKAAKLEKEIKGLKKSIGLELTALRKNKFKVSRESDVQLVVVNKAITSEPFEKRPHEPEQHRVEKIQDAVNDCISEIRQSLSII